VNKKPLHGIKILDLSRLLPGPVCTLHLADLGADVIKVEDTHTGDYARVVLPHNKTTSTFFLSINRNKRSISLDLSKEEGREVFFALALDADVIVESFRAGIVEKIGIDYAAVQEINAGIIYCSITGYGQTGPYSSKAGHDINFTSLAGILKPPLRKDGTPQIPNFLIGDIVGGAQNAVMAILAAIIQKSKTGKGQHLDISLFDGVLSHMVTSLSHLKSVEKIGIDTSDMLNGALHCYNLYETSDGKFMALGALEFKFWERFCNAVEREDMISKHITIGEETMQILNELNDLFNSKSQSEWVTHFKDVDCCITPVLSLGETIDHPHVKERGTVVKADHPSEGEVTQFAFPYKSSEFDPTIERDAPMLGEHTEEVLMDAGYSTEQIASLKEKKVINFG